MFKFNKLFISLFIAIIAVVGCNDKKKVQVVDTEEENFTGEIKPNGKYAVVDFSADFMRSNPDFESSLENQLLMGTIVEVSDSSGSWLKVMSPDPYKGWITDMGLVRMNADQISNYINAQKYICTTSITRIYENPSEGSNAVSELIMGDLVLQEKANQVGDWVKVSLPSGRKGWVKESYIQSFAQWIEEKDFAFEKPTFLQNELVSTARKFLGVPYMWGGTSIKNVDCSGLTRSVYFMNGILLPRNASEQGRIGEEVSELDLQKGDLIFWGREKSGDKPAKATHVGIYIGDSRFIHASHVVRISSLDSSAPDYYDRKPLFYRRIINSIDKENSGVNSIKNSPFYFSK